MSSELVERLRSPLAISGEYRDQAAARIEALEAENKELRMQDDPAFTYAFVLRARDAEAERDRLAAENARLLEALSGACDQILDSYRTWVADDTDAYPRPGQIPRYDAARTALAGKQ